MIASTGNEGAAGGERVEPIILDASAELALRACAELATIAEMLQTIRDRVAPAISDRDLRFQSSRRSARIRIAPHPTLRRAAFAAEAALAAMRRVQDCVAAARSIVPGSGLSLALMQSEAQRWLDRAKEQTETIGRARQAIARELARVQAGVATIVDFPPPALGGDRR
jgi:hypothetical protein